MLCIYQTEIKLKETITSIVWALKSKLKVLGSIISNVIIIIFFSCINNFSKLWALYGTEPFFIFHLWLYMFLNFEPLKRPNPGRLPTLPSVRVASDSVLPTMIRYLGWASSPLHSLICNHFKIKYQESFLK